MKTVQLENLADDIRKLPAEGALRDRRLHRLTDLHASAEAATALQAAAGRTGAEAGVLSTVLKSASAVWLGGLEDRDLFTEDEAAYGRLREAIVSAEFLSLLPTWIRELRQIASTRPETGACTLATALELWSWTARHFRAASVAGEASTPVALDELAEILCPLLAARCLAVAVAGEASAADLPEAELRTDLCHVQAARTAASAAAACAELVFGYRRHLTWDAEGCAACYGSDELDELEALIPGMASGARTSTDIIESDGSHPAKAGPCARYDGVDPFMQIRNRLDACLTGARFARDRAATAIARSMAAMLPEAKA